MLEIFLTITHRCYVRGLHVEPGTEVALTPTDAQLLLDTGRGQLLDPMLKIRGRRHQTDDCLHPDLPEFHLPLLFYAASETGQGA